MLPNDPRRILVDVCTDPLGACDDEGKALILERPTLSDSWPSASRLLDIWVVNAFITDPFVKSRFFGTLATVNDFYRDLASLEGKAVNMTLVDNLQRRLVHTWFPTGHVLLSQSKGGMAEYAAQALLRLAKADPWLTKLA